MLIFKQIHKSFGDARVLSGINLRLEKGLVYYTPQSLQRLRQKYDIENHLRPVETLDAGRKDHF